MLFSVVFSHFLKNAARVFFHLLVFSFLKLQCVELSGPNCDLTLWQRSWCSSNKTLEVAECRRRRPFSVLSAKATGRKSCLKRVLVLFLSGRTKKNSCVFLVSTQTEILMLSTASPWSRSRCCAPVSSVAAVCFSENTKRHRDAIDGSEEKETIDLERVKDLSRCSDVKWMGKMTCSRD